MQVPSAGGVAPTYDTSVGRPYAADGFSGAGTCAGVGGVAPTYGILCSFIERAATMPNPGDEISVALLRRLAEAPQASQRELARDTGVSLGKLNYALRALIDQGWVKAGNFGRNQDKLSYAYLLTPAGIEAKARLTRAFLARKMAEYDRLRAQIEDLKAEIGDGR